jgi:hypothetical protein
MAGRYDSAVPLTFQANGAIVTYLTPRILPMAEPTPSSTAVRPGEVHRLDLIANRVLGDPMLAWRVADANNAMDPFDLCAAPGAVLAVPATGL